MASAATARALVIFRNMPGSESGENILNIAQITYIDDGPGAAEKKRADFRRASCNPTTAAVFNFVDRLPLVHSNGRGSEN
jgi:hypothetical protein